MRSFLTAFFVLLFLSVPASAAITLTGKFKTGENLRVVLDTDSVSYCYHHDPCGKYKYKNAINAKSITLTFPSGNKFTMKRVSAGKYNAKYTHTNGKVFNISLKK